LNERIQLLRDVNNRLVWSLAALVIVGIAGSFFAYFRGAVTPVPTPVAVFFVGFVGGFVGLQRRLKTLSPEDLALLGRSWVCIVISPIAGAILAELLYLLFIYGLLAGNMFPSFVADQGASSQGLMTLFEVHCPDAANYAKVLFWSFVAGFSEKFATNIIRQFEPGESAAQNRQSSSGAVTDLQELESTIGSTKSIE
jgi:hypothetical protein